MLATVLLPAAILSLAAAAPPAAPPVADSGRAGAAPATPTAGDTGRTAPMSGVDYNRLLVRADSAIKARGGSRADSAQLFLSWNAPWGHRRAKRTRMPACADSTVEDTLYLCMSPGRTGERFSGFTADMLIRATGPDSLGPWWYMQGKGGANPGSLRIEWSALQDWEGYPQPYYGEGRGQIFMETRGSECRLKMIFAVALQSAGPIEAKPVYTLGRLVFKHRPDRKLAGCEQPVVVEWTSATLAFGPRDEPRVARGERFVTFGGPYALAEPYKAPRPRAWKPGGASPK